jgi:D-alanyl-D-alanine carboxypeptidase/D-alanyl-D-alanine-endopeptidase (penicillin-binding protein 4)
MAGAQASSETLQSRLDAKLNEPQFVHAQWGIEVADLNSGKILFVHNADKLMKPASNAKLYTAALALDQLGPDYRIKTSFYADAKPVDGVIHGDLVVFGRGDPSFSARFNDGDYSKALKPVIDAVLAAGIKRVEGDLIGDDSYFRGPPYGTEWTWDDLQNYYGAPASALTFQDNVIDLIFKPDEKVGAPCEIVTMPATTFMVFSNRTETVGNASRGRIRIYKPLGQDVAYVSGYIPLGSKGESDSVSVDHPALWFVTMLKEALAAQGVTITGSVREMTWLDRETAPFDFLKMTEVAHVESRPLSEIVKNTLKPSENLYAQLMLLQVGATHPLKRNDLGTEAAGLYALRYFLKQAGIDTNTVLLQEGSGLSRAALVTPRATVELLTFMSRHRYHETFLDALPIAGVDGTLRNRFKGTRAAGNVRAKTGSLGFVDALSGFCTNSANEPLVFSIMLNNYREDGPEHNGRVEIDKLVNEIVK